MRPQPPEVPDVPTEAPSEPSEPPAVPTPTEPTPEPLPPAEPPVVETPIEPAPPAEETPTPEEPSAGRSYVILLRGNTRGDGRIEWLQLGSVTARNRTQAWETAKQEIPELRNVAAGMEFEVAPVPETHFRSFTAGFRQPPPGWVVEGL